MRSDNFYLRSNYPSIEFGLKVMNSFHFFGDNRKALNLLCGIDPISGSVYSRASMHCWCRLRCSRSVSTFNYVVLNSSSLVLLVLYATSLFSAMFDLKQQLNAIDYFGVVAVWLCFFSIVFIISVTCILWCCVSKDDDQTVFAKVSILQISF